MAGLSAPTHGLLTDPGKPREACGLFGVFRHEDAARLAYYGLYAVQHRGQESAGIAVADGQKLVYHRGMGLVSEVFDARTLASLPGHLAIGHVRYSTTGESLPVNAQPLVVKCRQGVVAVAHNGNLVNARELRSSLEDEGSIFQTTSDSEVVLHLLARSRRGDLVEAVAEAMGALRGAYSFLFLTEGALLAARDPHGIRPLSVARWGETTMVASETCAFDMLGAAFVRDVRPGEILVVDESGARSVEALPPQKQALCIFEFIYFARPDSDLAGRNVHLVRKQLGRRLARDFPVEADVVTGVPDSSISAAIGFAEESGIPYEVGLIKNRYIGRTFIQPGQKTRALGVTLKLNAVSQVVAGKRVVMVDDSIVRGTTSGRIVKLLRDAGAREVHVRVSSPPYMHPCYYGIDTPTRSELVASREGVEEIRRRIGADSLKYLGLEGVLDSIGLGPDGFCEACFTGDYPISVS